MEFWYASTLVTATPPKTNGGQALTTMFSVIVGGIALGQAAPNLTAFAKGKAAAWHIFELIARKSAIDSDDMEGACLEQVSGRIELRNVRFSYPARPDVPIFQVRGNF